MCKDENNQTFVHKTILEKLTDYEKFVLERLLQDHGENMSTTIFKNGVKNLSLLEPYCQRRSCDAQEIDLKLTNLLSQMYMILSG